MPEVRLDIMVLFGLYSWVTGADLVRGDMCPPSKQSAWLIPPTGGEVPSQPSPLTKGGGSPHSWSHWLRGGSWPITRWKWLWPLLGVPLCFHSPATASKVGTNALVCPPLPVTYAVNAASQGVRWHSQGVHMYPLHVTTGCMLYHLSPYHKSQRKNNQNSSFFFLFLLWWKTLLLFLCFNRRSRKKIPCWSGKTENEIKFSKEKQNRIEKLEWKIIIWGATGRNIPLV